MRDRAFHKGWSSAAGLVQAGLLLALACAGLPSAAHASDAPLVVYSDIVSGPNTGGENNRGIYLSVFGKNFGEPAGLGTTTRLYVGGVEVDNYRYLGLSRGRPDIQQLTAQIGALGNPATDVGLPIKVVVNGKTSNSDLTFTVHPGTIYFVSPQGVDTSDIKTGGTFAAPFRTVQKPGLVLGFRIQPASVSGAYGRVQAGDFIVLRGGDYSGVGFPASDGQGFFMQALNKSGCPIGTNCPQGGGLSSGPITIMGYPTEDAFVDRTNTMGDNKFGGGFSSADRARQEEGYGAWFTIVNLRIESGFNDGPINTQRGDSNPMGSHWRVVNNELTGTSCQISTKCRAGTIAGDGEGNYWVGNYGHDVYDKPDGQTDFENHGIYVGGDGSYEIAYNVFANIFGGNGIQTHGSNINNVIIHHNLIHDVGKHGINIADGSKSGILIYDNVVYGTDVAGLRFNSDELVSAKVYNNTFFNTDRLNVGGSRGALMNDGRLAPDSLEIRNNIIVPEGGSRSYLGGSIGFGTVADSVSNNLWFNGKGAILGSANVRTNPQFVSTTPKAENFRLKPDSPAIDTGTAVVARIVTNGYDISTLRPQGRGFDIGAFEVAR